ncbi:hypothetical protein ACFQ46_11740 [Kineococcus sp. GCM10028916]|uniref:hypothetical protein n=1 Tax=Kineococcus sp. GCM10028916 TaxID=3273394 RepID=UPI003629ED2D
MTGPLDLSGWSWGGSAAGSLYAVPAEERLAAAHQLDGAGWWVHVDLVLDPSGVSTGVSVETLQLVRESLPQTRLEVHVIDLGPVPTPLDVVLAAQPDRVVLSAGRCRREGEEVRAAGAQVWVEHAGSPLPPDLVVDGALVMLIDPGTTQPIDLARLDAVASLPPGLPVGVDGGVGRAHVQALTDAGVQHLVSGRALLSQQHQHIRPRATEESRR